MSRQRHELVGREYKHGARFTVFAFLVLGCIALVSAAGPQVPPAVPSQDWPVFMHDPRQLGLTDSALDPHTLAPWSVPLGSLPASAPVVRGGVAYVGTAAGDVFAIDMTTRAVRWRQRLPSGVQAAPAAGEAALVVSAGGLYGLSPADGSILWQRLDLIPNDGVAPMLVGNTVFVGARVAGSPNRIIYALNATMGAGIWPLAFTLSPGLDTRATAAAFPELGLLLVGLGPPATDNPPSTGPGSVIALRLSDGTAAWPAPVALPAGPPPSGLSLGWAAAGTGVQPALFAATGGTVSARNVETGEVIWNRSLPETTLIGPPVVSATAAQSTTLFVGGASGHLYALKSSTGADAGGAWASNAPVAHPIVGALALGGSYLYAPTVDGLSVFDINTGQPVWNSPLATASSVAIAAGAPSVTTTDNLFVGFSVGSVTPPLPAVVHDVAISQVQAPAHVSRQADAQVLVTAINRGTQAETCELLLRVQPGRVVIAQQPVSLATREAKTVTLAWPTPLMGEDGPKTLVAELSLQGQTDSNLANNEAIQFVVVGP